MAWIWLPCALLSMSPVCSDAFTDISECCCFFPGWVFYFWRSTEMNQWNYLRSSERSRPSKLVDWMQTVVYLFLDILWNEVKMTWFTEPNSESIFGSIQGKTSLSLFIILRDLSMTCMIHQIMCLVSERCVVTSPSDQTLIMSFAWCALCNKRTRGKRSDISTIAHFSHQNKVLWILKLWYDLFTIKTTYNSLGWS